jgi:Replication-relaxation
MLTHELAQRDAAVVQCVGRLNQVASTHIQELLFNDVSRIPRDRCLARLVRDDYVMRVGRRAPGPKGGNAPVVYQLGRRGWWYLGKAGKYWGRRAVSEHSLIVADIYTRLVLLDRSEDIKLLAAEPEYAAGHSRADLFVDAGIPAISKRRKYYLEVQRSSRPDVIGKKLQGYGQTFDATHAEVWPYVVFVVLDGYHKREVAKQVPGDVR